MKETQLKNYRVIRKIGQGAMGSLYLAEKPNSHRVVLKVLPPEVSDQYEMKRRFEREAAALQRLNHPNIIDFHGFESQDDLHWIVMEYVQGKTLSETIPLDGLPWKPLFGLFIPLVEAIKAAHQEGIVHRDLKPNNVMVTVNGNIKVLDFGLAKLKKEAPRVVTENHPLDQTTIMGSVRGSALYMSPEQAAGDSPDIRTDVYALGVILYEMATGKLPRGMEQNEAEILLEIEQIRGKAQDQSHKHLYKGIAQIIAKCMALRPENRFQDASEILPFILKLKEIQMDNPAKTPLPAKRGKWTVFAMLLFALGMAIWAFFLLKK